MIKTLPTDPEWFAVEVRQKVNRSRLVQPLVYLVWAFLFTWASCHGSPPFE